MSILTVAEAQAHLPQLIDQVRAGEDVEITLDDQTVVRLVRSDSKKKVPRIGRGKDKLVSYVDDDAHLWRFEGYPS